MTWKRWFRRRSKPDQFMKLICEQAHHTQRGMDVLLEYIREPSEAKAVAIHAIEKDADEVRRILIDELNHSFVTPIDREDLHRAIINLDEIINSCKTIVVEMDSDLLGTKADKHCIEMAAYLKEGAVSIAAGYGRLGSNPKGGRADADKAEKAVKKFTRSYRRALAELFNDNDFHHIFRRKEIYNQLLGAADRLNVCNSTLLDIVVKLC